MADVVSSPNLLPSVAAFIQLAESKTKQLSSIRNREFSVESANTSRQPLSGKIRPSGRGTFYLFASYARVENIFINERLTLVKL